MTSQVTVRLQKRTYPIWLDRGHLSHCQDLIRKATSARKFLLLSALPIHRRHGRALEASLRRLGRVTTCLIPDGEKAKNARTLFEILRRMARSGFQRDGCLVALGGGVVGDLGGLAGGLYMRGLDVIQCPTTLLAQVDASVGGKTAIDFEGVKNLVGLFYQPKAVLIDTSVLNTLPDRFYRAGLAEVVKHGVIRDASFFGWMESHVKEILARRPFAVEKIVRRSCEIKAAVVASDEREAGERAHLNFGHTLGHGLEAAYDSWGLQHGEAVAYGMWLSAILSWKLGWCKPEVPERIGCLLRRLGHLGPLPGVSIKRIIGLVALDKKSRGGKAQFVLTRKMGVVSIRNVPNRLISWVLRRLHHSSHDLPGCA